MVAVYYLWHVWTDSSYHRPDAAAFLDAHGSCLNTPSPTAFTVGLLSSREPAGWGVEDWVELARARRAARLRGKEAPLPARVDALLQLEAAHQLECVGRHDEAIAFAANAVEECPGDEALLRWEQCLLAGDHDSGFDCRMFPFGDHSDAAGGGGSTDPAAVEGG